MEYQPVFGALLRTLALFIKDTEEMVQIDNMQKSYCVILSQAVVSRDQNTATITVIVHARRGSA
jgi:hypothetical protein